MTPYKESGKLFSLQCGWGKRNVNHIEVGINWMQSCPWQRKNYSVLLKIHILRLLIHSGFFSIRTSVRLSDRSKWTQNKIHFINNCPQWSLNPRPPDHHANALLTVLGRNLLGRRFLKWALFHAPLHMLDLETIEFFTNPTGDNVWWNLFCSV